MCQFKLKTHREGQNYEEHHFFILSKGNNAGRPMKLSCPNCFSIVANTKSDLEQLYGLTYALWQGRKFEQSLVGSVIPFIRIDDVKKIIRESFAELDQKPGALKKTVSSLVELEKQEANYEKLQKMIRLLKQSMVHQLLNG